MSFDLGDHVPARAETRAVAWCRTDALRPNEG
jgi:hypothetical protein